MKGFILFIYVFWVLSGVVLFTYTAMVIEPIGFFPWLVLGFFYVMSVIIFTEHLSKWDIIKINLKS